MADTTTYPLYPMAIIFPILSIFGLVLILPQFYLHLRNKNVGFASLIFSLVIMNLFSFINALIWPRDDMENWWYGYGLCDIEVRIMVGAWIGLPTALVVITSDLAKILDTERLLVSTSYAGKRRKFVLDMTLCFGIPILFMILYYAVQSERYYIFGITGCQPAIDNSWVGIVLIFLWPALFSLIFGYNSCLLVWRMYRYRQDFSRLLQASDTTKNAFLRLCFLASILALGILPVSLYTLIYDIQGPLHPYSWSDVHGEEFSKVIVVPSHGSIFFDRWARLIGAYVVFLFGGFGSDAIAIYKRWLVVLGFGVCFPRLKHHRVRGTSNASSNSWFSQKWKGLGKSITGWTTSRTTASTLSPTRFDSKAPTLPPPYTPSQPRQSAMTAFWSRKTLRHSDAPSGVELLHARPLDSIVTNSTTSGSLSSPKSKTMRDSFATYAGPSNRLSLGLSDLEEIDLEKGGRGQARQS